MIYETIVGTDFQKLHPKLQHRYALRSGTFRASGMMQSIETGAPWLQPVYYYFASSRFLFPESGTNIPFTITNTSYINESDEAVVYWERAFQFPHATRYFNATMTADLVNGLVKDYVGDPARFYSALHFSVTAEGSLLIRSGVQRAVFGALEIPLPKKFATRVVVLEGYDDTAQCYTIHVHMYHPHIGRMMSYAGTFTETTH